MSGIVKLKKRDEIEQKYKWEIEKMYKDAEAWEEDFQKLKSILPEIIECSGKLHLSKELLGYLKKYEEAARIFDKLSVYAHQRADEDTTNALHQSLKSKIDAYESEMKSALAFFEPEILSMPEGTIQKELNELEELKMYEFYLNKILIRKPHTLDKEQEKILAAVSDCLNGPANIFGMLTNADMTFPVIKDENDNDVELTEGNYINFITSKNRRVREDAFKAMFGTYGKFRNTLATSLTSAAKNFIFKAKMKNYSSALESSVKPNNIPVEVFNNTIDTINKNLSSLHRYVSIKKKLLNLDEIHMYDLYVPIVDSGKDHIEFEDGVEIVKKGIHALGAEYISIFEEGIKEGWVDVFENKGKRGGAYSWGCYDSMPYVLLNYTYQLNDVSTLAHEMGHSIHSYYSKKNQPYIYSGYELFCAEVASITNETLLIDYLINNEKDKSRRLFLINQELEQIRTTVFRQTMFAEFEKIVHEKLENGNPLSADDLCSIYHELNERYFGKDMVVDTEIDMEWSRIPHFYRDFYVYQYATGYAAANSFKTAILEKGESAVESYKGFLKSGGSDYPINILKKAGVDMTIPKPLEDTVARFNKLLDLLEREI